MFRIPFPRCNRTYLNQVCQRGYTNLSRELPVDLTCPRGLTLLTDSLGNCTLSPAAIASRVHGVVVLELFFSVIVTLSGRGSLRILARLAEIKVNLGTVISLSKTHNT